nr:nicotinate-nucleotide--dimethylbenzimidazole phosphoribosyltransferase [Streptomyces sp. NBC_00899]WSX80376.1 nicotinate-nucleotide--dimethylbenzimidazole phosphoribosyltransferase [Streptomyces sp. NBC_00899]
MTDTGQIPGEGLPENAVGEAAPQPHTDALGAPQATAPGWGTEEPAELGAPAYTYLDQPAAPGAGLDDDEDVLLMPGPQGTWSDPQPVPPQPLPVAETPAPDYGTPQGVDTPSSAPAAPAAPRRPLHMGPPVNDTPSGGVSVRSLADRGPAQGGTPVPTPVRLQGGPPTSGPEYLDVPQDDVHGIPAQQTGESADPATLTPGSAWPAAHTPSQQSLIPHADSVIPSQPAPEPILAFAPAEPEPAAEQTPYADAPAVPAAEADAAPGAEPVALTADTAGQAAVPPTPVAGVPVVDEPVAVEQVAVAAGAAEPAGPVAGGAEQVPVPSAPAGGAEPAGPVAGGAEPAPVPVLPALDDSAGAGVPVVDEPVVAEPLPPVAAEGDAGEPAPAEEHAAQAGPALSGPAAALSGALQAVGPTPPIGLDLSAPPAGPAFAATGTANLASLVAAASNAPAQDTGSPAAPAEAAADAVPAVLAAPVAAEVQAAPDEEPAAAAAVPVEVPEGRTVRRAARAHAAPSPEQAAEEAAPVTADAPAEAAPETADAAPKGRRAARRAEARAAEAEASEPAEAYEPAVRDAVHRVIRERRDIRNGFRSDPIPHDVLLRVLEAAHTAPSVGHSQPWDFVVIRSEKTREKMHELAMAQREAYAKSLPKGRARQFRELKIEAILDTPVNIVVTADPTRGGRHTLGRHTQPQMAPYSSALAVENLWLAARAEGLGVGWVSFFDERQMVAELGLPEHLEVVAYLCVGYVDEFPEEPELMQAGWSQRRPLSWVVHDEEYGNRALPGEEPHDLLEETLRGIRPLDAKALGEAWERQKRMTKPAGALGMLEIISAQLSGLSRQCPPPIPEPAAVAIFAGDHGVHAQGVTAWPQEVTGQMVANFLGGGAVCNAFANQVGAEVCVIDVGVASELPGTPGLLPRKVRPGTADFTVGPAMTREEALRAIEVGIETARDLVAAGNKALLTGEMGIANTTTSAALIAVYTGVDPAEVTGRGTGINDEMHARKVDVVRRALDLHRPDPDDPIAVLTAIGGLEHAAMVGLLLGAAALRTPVILDGVSAGAAALVARAIAPEVLAACIAGHRSAEPGHVAALTTLGLRPLVDLDLRLGEGTGALLALPLVQSAARVMHEVATFDAAGVTEKA